MRLAIYAILAALVVLTVIYAPPTPPSSGMIYECDSMPIKTLERLKDCEVLRAARRRLMGFK